MVDLLAIRDDTVSDQTAIAAMALRVRVPAELRAAVAAWRSLQSEYVSAQNELRRLVAEDRAVGDAPNRDIRERAIARVGQLTASLSAQVGPALERVRQARRPYLDSLRSALRPFEVDAARRALAALDGLDCALGDLDAVDKELAAGGGEPSYWNIPGATVAGLRQRLTRILT